MHKHLSLFRSAETVFCLIVSISDRSELALDSLALDAEALAEFVEIDQLALGPEDVNANKNHQQKDDAENTN